MSPFVKYWLHAGMLMVKGEEMHKSLGNFWTVRDALVRWPPEVLRFFFLNAHYRSPADFTPELVDEAARSYGRLQESVRSIEAERRRAPSQGKGDADLQAATRTALEAFDAAMSDDFNTREALAAIFDYARADRAGMQRHLEAEGLVVTLRAFGSFVAGG